MLTKTDFVEVVRLYGSKGKCSLGRFDLGLIKDLPVAQGKYIKSFKIMGVPDLQSDAGFSEMNEKSRITS